MSASNNLTKSASSGAKEILQIIDINLEVVLNMAELIQTMQNTKNLQGIKCYKLSQYVRIALSFETNKKNMNCAIIAIRSVKKSRELKYYHF